MLVDHIIYDAQTGETRIEQVEVPDVPLEPPIPQPPTIEERVYKLEDNSVDLIATTWAMDDRIFEIEWFLEDSMNKPINLNLRSDLKMAGLSKFEQARILILAGEYERESFERQLRKYESRNLITKDELDILISMMDARELTTNN